MQYPGVTLRFTKAQESGANACAARCTWHDQVMGEALSSKRARWLPTVVLVAAVAGVGLVGWRARLLERYEQRQLVKEALKDPASADFGDVVPGKRGGATWCGSVNAKNSMGGYVGFQRYVAVLARGTDLAEVAFERGDDGFAAKWRLYCEP